jgi:predicted PurR-regulated permease PerM
VRRKRLTTRSDNPRALIRYALVALVLTTALVWTLYLVRSALLLIYVAALIAIGLSPVAAVLERHRNVRLPRWAAILVIYLALIGVLVAIGMLVVPPLVAQARELWAATPELIHKGQQWLIDRGVLSDEISLREAFQQSPVGSSDAVGTIFGAISGFVGGVFGLVTILLLAYYLLLDSDGIVRSFVRLFPRTERGRVSDACRRIATKVSAWLAGQLLLAGVIGASAAIGLWLLGVPYFYVLALIAGIGEMIPVVGPLLAAVPAIAVALSVSPATALFVAIFFVAQQQFENHVLVPKIMERQVGVSAVVVIVALIIGGSLLGIVGAILAVPTAAILQVLVQELTPEAATE